MGSTKLVSRLGRERKLLIGRHNENRDLPLVERREILKSVVKFQSPRIRLAEYFETSAEIILQSAREQGLEGVVAKRKDSRYEAGKRSGAWAKFRLNTGQELVIGGYVPGAHGSRVHHCRLLQGIGVDLCGESAKWICASDTEAIIWEAAVSCCTGLPIRESARGAERPLGNRPNSGGHEEMHLGPA